MYPNRITLTLSAESLARLDKVAEAKLKASRPISQQEWVYKTHAGRKAVMEISANPEFRALSAQDINKVLTDRYIADVGGSPSPGRPPILLTRSKVVEDLIATHLSDNVSA